MGLFACVLPVVAGDGVCVNTNQVARLPCLKLWLGSANHGQLPVRSAPVQVADLFRTEVEWSHRWSDCVIQKASPHQILSPTHAECDCGPFSPF